MTSFTNEKNQLTFKGKILIKIPLIIKFIIISGWILLARLTSYIIIFEYGYNNTIINKINRNNGILL